MAGLASRTGGLLDWLVALIRWSFVVVLINHEPGVASIGSYWVTPS